MECHKKMQDSQDHAQTKESTHAFSDTGFKGLFDGCWPNDLASHAHRSSTLFRTGIRYLGDSQFKKLDEVSKLDI